MSQCGCTPTFFTLNLEWTADVFPGAEPVFVSTALQKAKIIVNEDGTQASAATSEYFCYVGLIGFTFKTP